MCGPAPYEPEDSPRFTEEDRWYTDPADPDPMGDDLNNARECSDPGPPC